MGHTGQSEEIHSPEAWASSSGGLAENVGGIKIVFAGNSSTTACSSGSGDMKPRFGEKWCKHTSCSNQPDVADSYVTDNFFDRPLEERRAEFENRLAQALAARKAKGK